MSNIFAILLSLSAQAQNLPLDAKVLQQSGQLVTVRIAIGDPLRIFIVGREEAKLDLNTLSLTVRRLKPYPNKVLVTTREGDHFVVNEGRDPNASRAGRQNLEVTARVKNKSETLQFQIENSPK